MRRELLAYCLAVAREVGTPTRVQQLGLLIVLTVLVIYTVAQVGW